MFDQIKDNGLRRRVKQHVIAREHVFFASVQPGFEKTASDELKSFGLNVSDEFIEGGVEFTGRLDDCFTASIRSRTVSRILMRIAEFRSHDFYELERSVRNLSWDLYLAPEIPVKFSISAKKSMIYHTGKLQEIFEREIAASFAFKTPSGDESGPLEIQTLFVRNFRDICTVSIDASGEFLYKRGAKKLTGKAPIRETLASLILLEARLNKYDMLFDPMCGSGTFSIEGASILTETLPNSEREFPFMNWPSFKENNFLHLKKSLMTESAQTGEESFRILTSDIDPDAVKLAVENIPENFKNIIKPEVSDFFSAKPEIFNGKKTLIVLNPPYGKRIEDEDICGLYREIGTKIKTDFADCGYAVIVPGSEAEEALSLEYDRKIQFMNGGIRAAVIFRDA